MSRSVAFLLVLLAARSLAAQQPPSNLSSKNIPIRQLGPVTAEAKDTIGPRIVVRGLSNGSVLVGIFPYQLGLEKRRVKLYDATLQQVTVVRDSSNPPSLIRYLGDSTIALDQPSRSLIVLDEHGKVARTMALTRTQDFGLLTGGIRPSYFDDKGRLLYQGAIPGPPPKTGPGVSLIQAPFQPDSALIVRADFDTRKTDTITTIHIARPQVITLVENGRNVTVKFDLNPFSTADEWAALTDGTIAIVRARDYHIDWVDPDGTQRSSPKMPFDWRRLTDSAKQFMADTMKHTLDSLRASQPPQDVQTPEGPRHVTFEVNLVPPDKLPDYEPPIGPGSVRADLDGNLWVVPRTTLAAQGGGLIYDVINRNGEIKERVQFPKGVVLAGFGPGGVVYLNRVVGTVAFLERAKLR